MLVDSHCHLNYPDLLPNLNSYLDEMKNNSVGYALCVATHPSNFSDVVKMATDHSNLFASVGVHPDDGPDTVVSREELLEYSKYPKVVAIGETGLDYYHTTPDNAKYQHDRFILHMDVAKETNLPLIIHTRNSFNDTINMMRENNASQVGAVMHCFTENLECAKICLELGFYISISGVVTFKNAHIVKEMAKYVPLDRLLVETDAPFLAPTPFRGKTNHPALVIHTAHYLAELKGISFDELSDVTTNNFFKLFKKAIR